VQKCEIEWALEPEFIKEAEKEKKIITCGLGVLITNPTRHISKINNLNMGLIFFI
jgi:hypothetical protein